MCVCVCVSVCVCVCVRDVSLGFRVQGLGFRAVLFVISWI
jgi:hypothetical protein